MASSASGGMSSSTGTQKPDRALHQHINSLNQGSFSSSLNLPSRSVSNGVRSRDRHSSFSKRSVTPNSRSFSAQDDNDPVRVRVAVRLRPKNSEDLISDADFADCVELQPELKRLKLRKNNWSSESYKFDEVFTETASQKRVYEVVAKPVVEGVLNGYNGTVMAYGQTGTGKTYTVGRLGKDDAAERGIMVRAMEDIMANTSTVSKTVEISYLQLYMESIQDLLAPEKNNIPINEDPKTGEVSLPGAVVIRVQDLDHFLQVLQIGESNRHAANTKLNSESSRSHAILMVYVRQSIHEKIDGLKSQAKIQNDLMRDEGIPIVRKSKLLIVDLAGSERLDKSGSEGHFLEEAKFINLSLTSLGKCINALAENSPHIPTRDSKLTRLLRDSFGGSARTSLIITIGPSVRHHTETTSTIMFGQRAMKIVNMVKLKEEFDYESLCRKLETQVDHLTAEIDRQQKLRDSEKCNSEKKLIEYQNSFAEAEKNLVTRCEKENARLELEVKDILKELNLQKDHKNLVQEKITQLELSLKNSKQHELENSTYQKVLADTTQLYEKKMVELIKQQENERARFESAQEQLDEVKKLLHDHQKSVQQQEMKISTYQKALSDTTLMYEKKIAELIKQLENEHDRFEGAEEQLNVTKKLLSDHQNSVQGQKEIDEVRKKMQEISELHESTRNELESVKANYDDLFREKENISEELQVVRQRLLSEEKQRKAIEHELIKLKNVAPDNDDDLEDKELYMNENGAKGSSAFGTTMSLHKSNPLREKLSGQRATIAKICEEVGLQKILQLLTSEETEVQIQVVKVVANLAAEGSDFEEDD